MYRLRMRPKYSAEELSDVYSTSYDHTRWPDHIARVEKTIDVGREMVADLEGPCLADLSCGDAAIVRGIDNWTCHQLGDFSPGYEYQGPIEETILRLDHRADLFILSETVEHLWEPEAVLSQIRGKSDRLLLSTPKMTWPDPNIEHYHCWDDEAVIAMLIDTGWTPVLYREQYNGLGYTYQIHGCV